VDGGVGVDGVDAVDGVDGVEVEAGSAGAGVELEVAAPRESVR
jgi:hypothetical protein